MTESPRASLLQLDTMYGQTADPHNSVICSVAPLGPSNLTSTDSVGYAVVGNVLPPQMPYCCVLSC